MHKLLLLLSCWLIASGSICQAPSAAFSDTPTITVTSVGKARLGMSEVQLKTLYVGCSFAPVHLLPFGFDDTDQKPNGIAVSHNKQRLFIYFLDWQTKKRIAGLLAFHPAYKTASGVHAGSTASALKAASAESAGSAQYDASSFPDSLCGPHRQQWYRVHLLQAK